MIDCLFSSEDFDNFLSSNPDFANEVHKSPIGLIDIGSRGGISSVFKPAAKIISVLGFEPDPLEVTRIENELGQSPLWESVRLVPMAVSDRTGTEDVYVLKHQVNSSMYPVDQGVFNRYKLDGFQLKEKISVNVDTIDNLVFAEPITSKRFGEILKIDAQGAELKILKGAERTLKERTCCILCEVAFFTPYENVPLFSEIETFLRERGFAFYGFLDFQQRSTRRISKVGTIGRERSMQADAIFFKDPLQLENIYTGRHHSIIVAALLFGYYDFAIEIVEVLGHVRHKPTLKGGIVNLAEATALRALAVTDSILTGSNLAHSEKLIALGKLVDYMRDFHTYHDIA